MLLEKAQLLENKVSNLETINTNLNKIDTIRSLQLKELNEIIKRKDSDIVSLKKKNSRIKIITGGSLITAIILAITCAVK